MLGKSVANVTVGGTLDTLSTPESDYTFSPPGADHRARWMAKGIYTLKIFAFRDQFKLTAHEIQASRQICLFTVIIYVKAWFSAPVAADVQ